MTPDPLSFTVHSMPAPSLAEADRRTRSGRMKMFLVLLVCAAPVVASYFTYFVIRPGAGANYSTLISPQRPIPEDLPLSRLDGQSVPSSSLLKQWLIVVVGTGRCDHACEQQLVLQRQLYETLGREKERVDKVWFVVGDEPVRPEVMQGITVENGEQPTVLRVPEKALAAWLEPEAGHRLEDHVYLVDPMGHWMMRSPAEIDPKRLKGDIDRLLRAAASWDQPGR